jgi:hypothetical protein
MRRHERTFKAEHKRLRRIARSEGRDPYPPAEPWVSVVERYRRSKEPRRAPRDIAQIVASAWEAAQVEVTAALYPEAFFAEQMRRALR